MIEVSGSGSVPHTNGSGWSKNIRIRLRVRDTSVTEVIVTTYGTCVKRSLTCEVTDDGSVGYSYNAKPVHLLFYATRLRKFSTLFGHGRKRENKIDFGY
jgi:hypothetical protein